MAKRGHENDGSRRAEKMYREQLFDSPNLSSCDVHFSSKSDTRSEQSARKPPVIALDIMITKVERFGTFGANPIMDYRRAETQAERITAT